MDVKNGWKEWHQKASEESSITRNTGRGFGRIYDDLKMPHIKAVGFRYESEKLTALEFNEVWQPWLNKNKPIPYSSPEYGVDGELRKDLVVKLWNRKRVSRTAHSLKSPGAVRLICMIDTKRDVRCDHI